VTAFSILKLLPHPTGKILSGNILFNEKELTSLQEKELCEIRGKEISMIFQEPMSALNPVMRIGDQIAEGLILHEKISKKDALAEAERILLRVGISDAHAKLRAYPHELSGGERQRAVIAMALICKPQLVIADEPTTALDVTIQTQILELLKELQREMGVSILFITHDLGLVKKFCDRTYVMYAGQIVESAKTSELFASPRHPYTQALLDARPSDAHPPKTPLRSIEGRLPTFWEWEAGCRFAPRCPYALEKCKQPQVLENLQNDNHRINSMADSAVPQGDEKSSHDSLDTSFVPAGTANGSHRFQSVAKAEHTPCVRCCRHAEIKNEEP